MPSRVASKAPIESLSVPSWQVALKFGFGLLQAAASFSRIFSWFHNKISHSFASNWSERLQERWNGSPFRRRSFDAVKMRWTELACEIDTIAKLSQRMPRRMRFVHVYDGCQALTDKHKSNKMRRMLQYVLFNIPSNTGWLRVFIFTVTIKWTRKYQARSQLNYMPDFENSQNKSFKSNKNKKALISLQSCIILVYLNIVLYK